MHNISNLFYFGSALYTFRTVFPSIVRSLRLYTQRQARHTGSADCLLAGTIWNWQFRLIPTSWQLAESL